MPRLAPQMNGTPCVLEHRLTLGTYERRELKKVVKAYQFDKGVENIQNIMLGTAGLVGAVALGFGLYKIGQGLSLIDLPDLTLPNLTDWVTEDNEAFGPAATHEGGISPIELFWGAPEYINYETGVTHTNPAYKWPLIGSLWGSGINIGIASINAWRD